MTLTHEPSPPGPSPVRLWNQNCTVRPLNRKPKGSVDTLFNIILASDGGVTLSAPELTRTLGRRERRVNQPMEINKLRELSKLADKSGWVLAVSKNSDGSKTFLLSPKAPPQAAPTAPQPQQANPIHTTTAATALSQAHNNSPCNTRPSQGRHPNTMYPIRRDPTVYNANTPCCARYEALTAPCLVFIPATQGSIASAETAQKNPHSPPSHAQAQIVPASPPPEWLIAHNKAAQHKP